MTGRTRCTRQLLVGVVAAVASLAAALAFSSSATIAEGQTEVSSGVRVDQVTGEAVAKKRFRTSKLVRPGRSLPDGSRCAGAIRSAPEIRPDNAEANRFVPVPGEDYELLAWTADTFGMADEADLLRQRIDGNFTGTTTEILDWGACKWGFRRKTVRAIAVAESAWRMSKVGDQDKGTPSYGILQVKDAFHPGTYPASKTSTAFNVDYALAYIRACYEGHIDWLAATTGNDSYAAGDLWGCVGHWFSGEWKDDGALEYVQTVRGHFRRKVWKSAEFAHWK